MQGQLQIISTRFFPLFLLVFNLVLKSLYLTSQDIGLDEPFTIYHAQFDFSTIIDQLKNYNNPPLYELLLHTWIKVFGISPLSVRILPLLFAVFSPVALYYFAKRNFSLSAAFVSSLLLSLSSLLNYYAHDCRVYSLFLVLSILSMHFFLMLAAKERKKFFQVFLFVLSGALLIYAHYFGFFILFFQCIYLLVYHRDQLFKFSAYYLAVLLLYLPHLYVLWSRLGTSVKNGTWIKPPSGFESLYNMLWAFSNYPFVTVLCIIILVVGIIIGIKKIRSTAFNKPLLLIIIWFVFPYFGMFFISYWIPMYISRYLVFVLPAYYILLVCSAQSLSDNLRVQKLFLAVLVICFAFTNELDPDKKQKISDTLRVVNEMKDSTTLVVVTPSDFLPSFAYHYNPAFFQAVADGREYHQTDSLLRNDHVFVVNNFDDLASANPDTYKKIIYLGVGRDLGLQYGKAWRGFTLRSEEYLNERFYIRVFSK